MPEAKPTKGDNIKKRQRYERLRSKFLLERSSFDQHWRDCGDYILPRRTRFLIDDDDQDKNGRRSPKIVDSTATMAARTLQSGLHSGITSPARPWFRLGTHDPDLADFGPVKQWLHVVTKRMMAIFQSSNIYNALPVMYGDLGVFGSPAMGILEDDEQLLRAYSYPIGCFAYGLNRRQIVDSFVIEYKMTVRQIVEEFAGEPSDPDWTNISRAVRSLWDKGSTENKVDVIWLVLPNADHDPDRYESKFQKWHSCYWEKAGESGMFLRESGFNEFPILAPRWHVTGFDWYASDCPGMTALADVRSLQIMERRKAQHIELGINPSLQGPVGLLGKKVSLHPGEVTLLDGLNANPNAKLQPIREMNPRALQFMLQDMGEKRQRVSKAFFEDLFLMLAETDRRQITAREVAERHEEKLLALGPVLERMNDELLDPLIDRTYAIMDRAGLIPPAPQEVQGQSLKIEYISIMAQAQKMVGAGQNTAFLQSTMPLIETAPIVRHKIRFEAIVDDYADLYGVNPKFIVPDEEAFQSLAQEQQQQAQMQKIAQAEQLSKSAKNLAGSNMDDNSALKQMLEGAQKQ